MEGGTELGWLIGSVAASVLIILLESRVRLYQGDGPLPTLPDLALTLSANSIMAWLVLES